MVGQWLGEGALDPLQMAGPNPVEDLSAQDRDGDIELPPILTTQGSFDEAVPFHPVQESRESASAQLVARDHGGDQCTQRQDAIPSPREVHQDIELLERHVLVGQVAGEAAHDETRRPLQIPPCREAVVVTDVGCSQGRLLCAIERVSLEREAARRRRTFP